MTTGCLWPQFYTIFGAIWAGICAELAHFFFFLWFVPDSGKAWQVRSSKRGWASILAYAVHVYLVKAPTWLGHLRYFLGPKPDAARATVLSEWKRET